MRFDQEYNRKDFLSFLGDFLPQDFNTREEDIIVSKQRCKKIHKAQVLGGSESLNLQVLEVEHESENDPRISVATDAFKILADHWIHKALIIFKSKNSKNYRLSLLTISLDLNEKNKTTRKYSNARRYSFYLGPGAKINTPTKYLTSKGRVVDFEDLKNRFSLEVVNKDFYKEISHLFTKLVGGVFGSGKSKKEHEPLLELPFVSAKSQTGLEFAVRLIGRVIFCWFLREKKSNADRPLMPSELLSLQATKENDDYYHKILEPIFFEVLNKPIKSRKDRYSGKFFDSIPYLNGGLFSPHDDDYYSYNENKQASYHNMVKVPDNWIQEFFEFLETYNFTIDENIAFDEELSIDPEMLGRIFENLLAEINPETGESARKSTGSYYTPRTIVDYMIDESLFAYLKEKTKIEDEKLRAIISYDLTDDFQFSLSDKEKEDIVDSLSSVKILDPACGSGAFPIGVLQKIVFILQQTDPDGQKWFKQQIKSTATELKRVIEREFANKNFDYIRKLGTIRENIFGVDIQPIATEISRLRCFLTLIVDEEVEDGLENRGIEPLPNLDFKFVTANSLIPLPSSNQANLFQDQENIDELKSLRDQFFSSTNAERHQLKDEFKELQKKMLMRMIEMRGGDELTQKLSMWDPFSHKVSPWFDYEWMFGVKEGFDIVIANPPYDVYQGHRREEIEEIRRYPMYEKATRGKLNAYKLFLARSAELQKPGGILCEIFQNSFLADNSASKIRKYFFKNQRVLKIDSFPERDNIHLRVFEYVKMSVCILISQNRILNEYQFLLRIWKDKYMNSARQIDLSNTDILAVDPENATIPSVDQKEVDLLKKISKITRLKNYARCYEGEINLTFHKKFLKKEKNGYAPMIKGAAVQRWLIKEKMSQGEIEYLDQTKYFKENTGNKSQHHKSKRIVLQGITGVDEKYRLKMTIIGPGIFCGNSVNYILISDKTISDHYLLGLLNSKLLNWFFKVFSTNSNVNGYEVDNLPILKALPAEQNQCIDKVEKIFSLTEKRDYLENKTAQVKVRDYENQIDQIVYKLYGLTPAEIKLVEGSNEN